MYISAIRRKNQVLVWERTPDHGRIIKKYPAPFYFLTENEDGAYRSIYGERLELHRFEDQNEFYKAKQDAESDRVRLYESDIPAEIKVLSQHYYNGVTPTLNITFFDIEVDYNPDVGFSSVANPYAPINSVAFFHQWKNKFVVFAVPPEGWDGKLDPKLQELAEITLCKDEQELLLFFIDEIQESDALVGWNSDFFDMPYVCKRVEKVLGEPFLKKLSFEAGDLPKYRDVETFGNVQTTVDLCGRLSVDYMVLFKKYEMEGRPSYKLEAIGEEILPDLPKLKYEGSLHSLYRRDFNFFVRYNIRDTEILKGFEEKLGYVALANEMYHISTGLFKHVTGTLKLVDLAIVNYCHHDLKVFVPDWSERQDGQIEGALVLTPKVGMHEWIGSIDINSLYPSAIRSINISPETLKGQFVEDGKAWEEIYKGSSVKITLRLENGFSQTEEAVVWKDLLKKRNWAVSGYGTVFDQTTKGIIPTILEKWFNQRKEYQKKKKQAETQCAKIHASYTQAGNKDEINRAARILRELKGQDPLTYVTVEDFNQYKKNADTAKYYDRLQYTYKIKLNSTYGALTNYFFRFFDLRMGESVTATGRAILRHQISTVGKLLDENYAVDADSVIYGDTDSVYFKTHAENKEEAISIADTIAKHVNESFQNYMQTAFLCNPSYDNIIKSGREVVADRGIFVDKKRYVLHLIDLDGQAVDKIKAMGLEMKKTTTPKPIQKFLEKVVRMILTGTPWDEVDQFIISYRDSVINEVDLLSIGLPKGVKGVEEYTQQYRVHGDGVKLPGHVAAAIHYNLCIDKFADKESLPIVSNMKIKVFYLKNKNGRFRSIALPTDIEQVPEWFNQFEVDRALHAEKLIDSNLEHIFTAIGKPVATKQTVLINDLLSF